MFNNMATLYILFSLVAMLSLATSQPPTSQSLPASSNTTRAHRLSKLKLMNRVSSGTDAALNDSAITPASPMVATVKPASGAPPLLKKIHDYLIVTLLVSVMFAMGCSITWKQVSFHLGHAN